MYSESDFLLTQAMDFDILERLHGIIISTRNVEFINEALWALNNIAV